jgi:hypothetical protein
VRRSSDVRKEKKNKGEGYLQRREHNFPTSIERLHFRISYLKIIYIEGEKFTPCFGSHNTQRRSLFKLIST